MCIRDSSDTVNDDTMISPTTIVYDKYKGDFFNILENDNLLYFYYSLKRENNLLDTIPSKQAVDFWPLPLYPVSYTHLTLSLSFPEFSLYDIKSSKEDVLKNAFFTAALYGDRTKKDNFMKSLDSLIKQNLIFMKIVVPVSMKADIEKEGLLQDNLLFEDSNSKEELFATTLNNAQTPYSTFCYAEITDAVGSFRLAYRQLMKQQYDFIS